MPRNNTRVQASRFAMQPRADVPRSSFDVGHGHKTTFNGGFLVPVFVDEVLPGDSLRLKMTGFGRLSTPIVPVMDNLYLESFFFFVPNRLVWENWERFMGQQADPDDATEFLTPQVVLEESNMVPGQIADYFGLTINGNQTAGASLSVLAFPFRGYKLIWNEFFRDEDLIDPVTVEMDDGPDAPPAVDASGGMRRRGKRHDYFTSARPWPQKPINAAAMRFGNAEPLTMGGAMTLPQAGAPVSGLGIVQGVTPTAGPITGRWTGGRQEVVDPYWSSVDDVFVMKTNPSETGPEVRVLINDIRTAQLVQAMMERNARGGTRYTEILQAHFGVRSPDARLQRPEYLGGGRSMITVRAVQQTAGNLSQETDTPLGFEAGTAQVVAQDHGFSASFVEHGWIIGMVNVRADLSYQNGVNRMWFRRSQFDYYWPGLNGLGEQAVLQKEIFTLGFPNALAIDYDNQVFGYQERWSEYKFKPARISGFFRSNTVGFTESLDYWHFSQELTESVALDNAFVAEVPPIDRVLQVESTNGEQVLFDALFDCRWVRAMPMYSLPGVGLRL